MMDKWPPEWLGWDKSIKFRSILIMADKMTANGNVYTEECLKNAITTYICPECGQEFINSCPNCGIVMGRRGWRQLGVYDG